MDHDAPRFHYFADSDEPVGAAPEVRATPARVRFGLRKAGLIIALVAGAALAASTLLRAPRDAPAATPARASAKAARAATVARIAAPRRSHRPAVVLVRGDYEPVIVYVGRRDGRWPRVLRPAPGRIRLAG